MPDIYGEAFVLQKQPIYLTEMPILAIHRFKVAVNTNNAQIIST